MALGKTLKNLFNVDIMYGIALLMALGNNVAIVKEVVGVVPNASIVGGVAAVIGFGVSIKERFFK